MIKTILICLVAVVVIIIVIGLLFRLFLRADDSDVFDELPDEPRRPSRTPGDPRRREPARREPALAAAAGGRRPSRPASDKPRPVRGTDVRNTEDRAQPGFRDRSGQQRQPGPDRRNGQGNGHGRPIPAAAPPAMAPRSAAAAAPSAQWDSLSDVDYWAELASDKPLTTPTAATADSTSPGSRRRRSPEPVAEARPAGRSTDQTERLPVRQRNSRSTSSTGGRQSDYSQPQPAVARGAHAPGRYAGGSPEPTTESLAALARLGNQSHPSAPLPVSQPRRKHGRPVPAQSHDDDPLTSPSFPAINASDSRSYRASRSDSQPHRSPSAPAAHSEPSPQFSSYQASSDRTTSAPNGYPVQPASPAGNPYGSFVTQPAASHQAPVSNPETAYSGRDAGYGQPAPSANGWHNGNGYPNGSQAAQGYDPNSYQSAYQSGQPETAGYPQPAYPGAQYDPRLHRSQEPGYGPDGYQGYTGYANGGY